MSGKPKDEPEPRGGVAANGEKLVKKKAPKGVPLPEYGRTVRRRTLPKGKSK